MTTAVGTIWSDLLAHLRLNHPDVVRGWFCDLTVSCLDRGVVTVVAMNDAQRAYLERHARAAFTEGAQAATGRLVSIEFNVRADGEPLTPPPDPFRGDGEPPPLDPDYTFDNFVTGPCNRLAHAAARAIADAPGRSYNPFFVHGSVGLGKTHLLQAVCHAIRDREADARFAYISCETFVNHFIEAVERGLLHQFRHRYRHADVLVIDDIQFLAERERSQEEFFHTFNTLHQSHRQIILSADAPPAEIPSLEERLVSRFNSGLVAVIDPPCLETRMAIVRKKARLRCIELPEDVVGLVASRVASNVRELEGALVKIDALSQVKTCPITVELARDALGAPAGRPVKIPAILEAVAQRFGVKVSDLQGKRRSKAVTHPRHVCMYLARQLTTQSLEDIGGYFGGRDHTTVLHANRLVSQMTKRDVQLRGLLDEIAASVKNGA